MNIKTNNVQKHSKKATENVRQTPQLSTETAELISMSWNTALLAGNEMHSRFLV
jgi:hypothetical protein